MNIRGRALIVACALLAGLMPGPADAAVPQDFSLTSIARISPDSVAAQESVEGTYTTTGPREADFVGFIFSDRIAGQFSAYGSGGSVESFTHRYEASGLHRLEYVYLNFTDDNEEIYLFYYRDGTVEYFTDDFENPTFGTHTLNFALVDFNVNNPGEDVTIPVIDSFEVEKTAGLVPGEDIRINFDVPQSGSPVYSVRFTYEAPGGRLRELVEYDNGTADTLKDFVARTVKKGWVGGTYSLKDVRLYDEAGLRATYLRDGTIGKSPTGAEGPNIHPLDLSAGDVTIDNPDPDLLAPQLISFSQETEPTYYPGEDAVFRYELADDSQLESAYLVWGSDESFASFSQTASSEADGKFVVDMTYWFDPGTYALERIHLTDDAENMRTFYRDGRWYEYETQGLHTVNLSAADFEIVAWPHSFENALGAGGIDIDFETGKFRFVLYPWEEDTHVQVATITELPGGAYRAVYSADGIVLDGIFEPATGSFAAEYEEGGVTYSLVGAASRVPPLPVPVLP